MPTIIEPTPRLAPEMLADRQRHDTVIMCASPTAILHGFPQQSLREGRISANPFTPGSALPVYLRPTNYGPFVALHQGISPQFAITWKWNCAIWDAGE